jgi:hypothetical protein
MASLSVAKRKKLIMEKLPVGALVRCVGDDWLDHITGQIAVVLKHGHDRWGTRCVFLQLSDQQLDVPYELMSLDDLELIE